MKTYLSTLVNQSNSQLEAINLVREYLQARILSSLQKSGATIPLAFYGGTALRFLYSYERFSEDLDFALEGNREYYNFRTFLRNIRTQFTKEGYLVDIKLNDQRVVHYAFVRFPGLLFELGL